MACARCVPPGSPGSRPPARHAPRHARRLRSARRAARSPLCKTGTPSGRRCGDRRRPGRRSRGTGKPRRLANRPAQGLQRKPSTLRRTRSQGQEKEAVVVSSLGSPFSTKPPKQYAVKKNPMIACPLKPDLDCTGPVEGEKAWICPVHGALLTPTWTRLCQTEERYREAWVGGCGPGQKAGAPRRPPDPELEAKRAAEQQRKRRRKAVCVQCPEELWADSKPKPGCPAASFTLCSFRRKLAAAAQVCIHWPE